MQGCATYHNMELGVFTQGKTPIRIPHLRPGQQSLAAPGSVGLTVIARFWRHECPMSKGAPGVEEVDEL